jgi:hypothetical protein
VAKRQFIGEFEARTCGQAVSYPGDGKAGTGQTFRQVKAGSVAFDIGAEGNHDLSNGLARNPLLELMDAKVLGFDAVQGGDFAAEDVVFSPESAGFLDADDVDRPLNKTNERRFAPGIGTNFTRGDLRQRTANVTKTDAFASVNKRLGQVKHRLGFGLHEVQGDALG